MNLRDYENDDGKKVWLNPEEVDRLLEEVDCDTEQYLSVALGVRCGLRAAEIVQVAPQDVVEGLDGPRVRVATDDLEGAGKGDKYRETPCPVNLASRIRTVGDVRDAAADEPVVDVTTRTVERWVKSAAESLQEETGDRGWQFLGPHDLRRTWATSLASADVDPLMVCDWGGWSDLETFLEHYRGSFSPEAQQRERGKVDWL